MPHCSPPKSSPPLTPRSTRRLAAWRAARTQEVLDQELAPSGAVSVSGPPSMQQENVELSVPAACLAFSAEASSAA